MATLYLKAAGGNFNGANWSTTGSGGGDSNTPTAADDCIMESGSGACTINSGSVCRSLSINTGTGAYNNTITHSASVTFTIGDGTAGVGNMALDFSGGGGSFAYTLGNSASSALSFISTSATQQTINFGSKATGAVTFNAASNGSWKITGGNGAAPNNGGHILLLTAGTLDVNGQTLNFAGVTISGSTTRTLTLGAGTINCSGTGITNWDAGNITNLTFNANTSTINTLVMVGGGLTYNIVTFTHVLNNSDATLTGTNTFATLTVTGIASKGNSFTITNNQTITGTLTFNGNSVTNRLLVRNSTLGTAVTLSAATIVTKWTDYRDITAAGAANWDLTAQGTDSSGNCGGNTGITFTTAANQTATGTASFTWSTHGWTSRVPLPQDNVFIPNAFVAGRVITCDMPRIGKTIDFTGCTGTPTWTNTVANTLYGSLTLVATITMSGTNILTFEGRSSFTITSAGNSFTQSLTFQAIGGTYTLSDAISVAAAQTITLSNGTFSGGNNNVTTGLFSSSNSNTRVLTMGSGTWTLIATSGTVWTTLTSTGLTLNPNTSTIVINDTGVTSKTFSGGGLTFANITFTGDNIIMLGNNSFNIVAFNNAGLTTGVKFTSGTTTTIIPGGSIVTNGASGSLAKILSTVGSSAFTISKATGQICLNFVSLQDSTATGGASFRAGANSTNVSGNTGWVFTNCPVLPASIIITQASVRYEIYKTPRSNRIIIGKFVTPPAGGTTNSNFFFFF